MLIYQVIQSHILMYNQKKYFLWAIFTVLALVLPIVNSQKVIIGASGTGHKKTQADHLYINGNFITMAEKEEKIDFVAIKDQIIIGVGTKKQIRRFVGKNTRVINLLGRTMMPGLIDAHSHFGKTACNLAQGFNISPPPFGTVKNIPQLLDSVREYLIRTKPQPGTPIRGFGYSDIDLAEGRHPTRYELDSVSAVHPIVLTHFSNHLAVGNSMALEFLNYEDPSAIPAGGVVDKFENGTITGVCRQWAAFPLIGTFGLSLQALTRQQILSTAQIYLKCGVTTAQDMIYSQKEAVSFYNLGDDFPIDINGYYWVNSPDIDSAYRIMDEYKTARFHIRGAKLILDGSIQGYTALLTNPYWVPHERYSQDLSNYTYDDTRSCQTEACGLDNFPTPTLLGNLFNVMLKKGTDIHVHCNGDAAADNFLNAIEWAKSCSSLSSDSRIAMIHAQTVRDDQLDRMKELGVFPSFFPAHLYYWGDKHYKIFLGPQRANRMNPAGSALRRGLKVTLHTDSPTVIAGIANGENTFLKLVSSAVNRKTLEGRTLDDGTQKISVYEAIKALTITAAWQSREQARKGSIQVGKLADLIILNESPLTVAPEKLDSLEVLATIKQGKLVFGSYPSQGKQKAFSSIRIQ